MEYPEPRYPKLVRPKSFHFLVSQASKLVNKEAWVGNQNYMNPGYGITSKDKVLLGILSESDGEVIQAFCEAIRQIGARVDVVVIDSTPLGGGEESSVHEIRAMLPPENVNDDYNYYYTTICNTLRTSTATSLVEKERYTKVISGSAGPLPNVSYPWFRFNYTTVEELVSGQIDFPYELQKLIDAKVWANISNATKVRLTDAEGTDITWSNYNDGRVETLCHEFGKPMYLGNNGTEDCTGVISGTLNHLGCFPRIQVQVRNGLVVDIKGGGMYGEAWMRKLEEFRDVRLPPYYLDGKRIEFPDKGFFWYFEQAIGTSPGAFRLQQEGLLKCFGNFLHERRRAGVIHHGFGFLSNMWAEAAKAGIPAIHCHIHSNFGTYEATMKDGTRIKVIDKGHLAALDDPEVVEMAKSYGQEDALKEAWIPAVPGINYSGSYEADYAKDPESWIKNETKSHNYWIN